MKNLVTTVTNLETGETLPYILDPKRAVIAAHAFEQKDFNTWDHVSRYGHLVIEMDSYVTCGNWTAPKGE